MHQFWTFSHLMNVTLRGDDVQGFVAKCDEVRESLNKSCKHMVLEKHVQDEAPSSEQFYILLDTLKIQCTRVHQQTIFA